MCEALSELSAGGRVVVAVDQLEELFTVCGQEGERIEFLDQLTCAADDPERRALVVVSLRADFYGRYGKHDERTGEEDADWPGVLPPPA